MTVFQSCRCLIVDRDTFMRRMLREMLRYHGIGHIDEARDGAQAQVMTEQAQYDLMITELNLPVLDAPALVSQIRRSKTTSSQIVPVIGYTEKVTSELVIAVRDAGIDEIIVKPFSSGVLQKKLVMTLQTPRKFIQSSTYRGPCRRRKENPSYLGAKRREADRLPPVQVIAESSGFSPKAMSQESLTKRLKPTLEQT